MIDLSIPKKYLANIIPIEFIIGKKQKLQIDYRFWPRHWFFLYLACKLQHAEFAAEGIFVGDRILCGALLHN